MHDGILELGEPDVALGQTGPRAIEGHSAA